MIALAIIGFTIARTYYRSTNSSVDPRIVDARELYSKYDSYAASGNYYRMFSLLDSIENIYRKYTHYQNSYEIGVLCNNRSASLITIALYGDSIRADYNPLYGAAQDSVLRLAESYALKSIAYYNEWTDSYLGQTLEEIAKGLESDLFSDADYTFEKDRESYIKARSKEITKALLEVDRRLSVAYTNLGVIYRINCDYVAAAKQYEKALELWDRNLSAENNLNALLGRPIKKRNILQKLFPPERDK